MAINLNDTYKNTIGKSKNIRGQDTTTSFTSVRKNAKPPTDMTAMESNKFLYDTRLQNVFNDYQQSIATLEKNEQKSLQDAYYIREMSKRYLGEYASNLGVGDVSGNLLDIYSSYQQNVGAIQENTTQMQISLQQTYDQQSRQAFESALATQQGLQQEQLDQQAQTTMFNVIQGNTGGVEWNEYLKQQLDSGAITEGNYQAIFMQIYNSKLSEVQANLERGFFGFKDDEEGNKVPLTAEEYIDRNKSWLNQQDLQKLRDVALVSSDGEIRLATTERPEFLETFGMSGGEYNLTLTDGDGNTTYYASAEQDVDTDSTARIQVTTEELTTAFEKQNPNATLASGNTTFQYKGNLYYYVETPLEGGKWYRMMNITASQKLYEDMKTNLNGEGGQSSWIREGGRNQTTLTTKYFTYDYKTNELKLTGGETLKYADSQQFPSTDVNILRREATGLSQEAREIRAEFLRVHGGTLNDKGEPEKGWNSIRDTVIFYKGNFYTITHNGKLKKFVKNS
jgi:hypothetical protein